MSGVIFSHPSLPTLSLRLAPTEVDWAYNLLTSETNTYAGQVVQVLGVNFENFTIEGKFGREGRNDYELRTGTTWVRKSAPSLAVSSKYGPGLTQMTEWFKRYFAVASQGLPGDDNYSESPVSITYQGAYGIPVDDDKIESTWKVYPTSFPSYKIANDNFAPQWRLECQVYEAPGSLTALAMDEAISRLSYSPLYQPGSKWSDPFPEFDGPNATQEQLRKAAAAALKATQDQLDHFAALLPAYTESDLRDLLARGFSTPTTQATQPKAKQVSISSTGDPFTNPTVVPGLVDSPVQDGLIK